MKLFKLWQSGGRRKIYFLFYFHSNSTKSRFSLVSRSFFSINRVHNMHVRSWDRIASQISRPCSRFFSFMSSGARKRTLGKRFEFSRQIDRVWEGRKLPFWSSEPPVPPQLETRKTPRCACLYVSCGYKHTYDEEMVT